MRSGKLRYPAKLVREIKSISSTGAEITTYLDILQTRVSISSINGRDYIAGGQEVMETTIKIIMRSPSKTQKRVLMGDLVLADDREFKIISVLDFDNNRSLQLMVKEVNIL